MNRAPLLLFIVIVLVAGRMTFAQTFQIGGETVRIVSTQDIKEKLDGKDMAMTVVEYD